MRKKTSFCLLTFRNKITPFLEMRSENKLFRVLLDLYFKLHTIIRFTLYRPSRCTFCLGQRAAGKDLRVGENRTEGSPGESFFKVCQQAQARPGSLRHRLASLCVAGNILHSSFLRNHPQNSSPGMTTRL